MIAVAQFGVYLQIKRNTVLGKVLHAFCISLGRSCCKFLQIHSVHYVQKYTGLGFFVAEIEEISRFGKYYDDAVFKNEDRNNLFLKLGYSSSHLSF